MLLIFVYCLLFLYDFTVPFLPRHRYIMQRRQRGIVFFSEKNTFIVDLIKGAQSLNYRNPQGDGFLDFLI
jgi:hypothetical protein